MNMIWAFDFAPTTDGNPYDIENCLSVRPSIACHIEPELAPTELHMYHPSLQVQHHTV